MSIIAAIRQITSGRGSRSASRPMGLSINDTAPDFEASTTQGQDQLPRLDRRFDGAVLFWRPKDFTPVFTTELGYMGKLAPEFKRPGGVKVIGLSVDATEDHQRWADDIETDPGRAARIPRSSATPISRCPSSTGCCPPPRRGDAKSRTPADNQTVRNVFVIGPDKKVKLILVYPMATGRNFNKLLRVIDSLQLTARHRVATPVNWRQGEDVFIAGTVSDDEARVIFGEWKSPRCYLRIVPQPR